MRHFFPLYLCAILLAYVGITEAQKRDLRKQRDDALAIAAAANDAAVEATDLTIRCVDVLEAMEQQASARSLYRRATWSDLPVGWDVGEAIRFDPCIVSLNPGVDCARGVP